MNADALVLSSVSIAYGASVVVHDLTLRLAAGEQHALLGPSGSGKTTVLRAVAGFASIARGRIELSGVVVDDAAHRAAPEARGVGVVFQDFALFPHLSVAQNVGFGCRKAEGPKAALVSSLLSRVGLQHHGPRPVGELSGGEQQRVAVARARAQEPRLILFDEPFASLNRELRRSLREATSAIVRERGIGALFVTHDPEEAFAVADRVSVMQAGRLLQTDTPRALYERPRSSEVARSVGEAIVLAATRTDDRVVECALGRLAAHDATTSTRALVLRPEQLRIHPTGSVDTQARGARAKLGARRYLGGREELELLLTSGERILAMARVDDVPAGATEVDVEVTGVAAALCE